MPPASPGTAALTDADVQDYVDGRATLVELGTKAGVSKQAIAKWLKRRGVTRAGTAAPSATPAIPPPSVVQPAPPTGMVEIEPGSLQELVPTLARHTVAALIARLAAISMADTSMAPSAIKAASTALGQLLDDASRLDLLDHPDDDERLPELVVRIMTHEEGEALRARIAASDGADQDDEPAPDDGNGRPPDAPVEAAAGDEERPEQSETDEEQPAPVVLSSDDEQALRQRLNHVGRRLGLQALRSIAVALDARPARDQVRIVDALVDHAGLGAEEHRALVAELDRLQPALDRLG